MSQQRNTALPPPHDQARAVLDAVPHAIALLNAEGKIAVVNAAWRAASPDFSAVLDPQSGSGVADAVRAVLSGEKDASSTHYRLREDDRTRWFQVVVTRRADAHAGALVMFEDRTMLRERYTEAVEANRILRDVLDHLPRRAFWKDVDGRILGGNTSFLLEFEAHNLVGKSIDEVPWPQSVAEFFRATDAKVVETGEGCQGLIAVPGTATREPRWLEAASAPLKRGDGSVIGTIGSYVDVTEEHLLRETVRESAERLRSTLETANKRLSDFVATASDWLWECDGDKVVTHVSERFFERSGYEAADVIGKPLSTFALSEVHQARTSQAARHVQESKDFRDIFLQFPLKDGSLMYVRLSGKAQRGPTGVFRGYLGTASDVTDAVRQGNAAKQTQKLQAVGTLASGVAHEFNNILAIIRGYADLTKRALERGETSTENVDQMIEAAARGTTLTKGLLALGRKSASDDLTTFDLADLADEQRLFLRPLVGPSFDVVVAKTKGPALIRAPREAVAQAIMNLVLNARDASPRGGSIDLAVDVVEAAAVMSRFGPPPSEGRYARVRISDDGVGMDAALLRRVFEPFFTTKEVGKGTGLGLHFVYQLVVDCAGYLNVESEVGKGTTFTLYFPETEAVPVARAGNPGASMRFTGLSALVVDDEPALAALYKSMLDDLGFSAIASSDPETALEAVDGHDGALNLILSDVLMPKIEGPRFAELATALRPEARVLFMTGQPERGGQSASKLPPGARVLRKPFTRDDLAAELAKIFADRVMQKTA